MKTTTIVLGLIIAALMVVHPVGAQENPTEQIKKEGTKVINRNIDKRCSTGRRRRRNPHRNSNSRNSNTNSLHTKIHSFI